MQLVMTTMSAVVVRAPGLSLQRRPFSGQQLHKAVSNGCKCRAFFGKIAKGIKDMGGSRAPLEADELYHSPQSRQCYSVDDAKDYYTITGWYAETGSYDLFERMVAAGIAPVDLVLLIACHEGDDGKVEECLKAGAHADVKDMDGVSAIELATKDEIKEMLQAELSKKVAA